MNKQAALGTLVTLALAMPAHATIRENFPGLDMAFVGNHVITGPARAFVPHPFALRLTDPAGHPLPGLTVYFQPDYVYSLGVPPPLSVYGSFGGILELAVVTDANGVARSPDFQIGPLIQNVIAGVPPTTPENVAVTQGGWGYALFHVNAPHEGPVDPQAPDGNGVATTLPTNSFIGLASLAAVLVVTAFVTLRNTLHRRSTRF